MVFLWRLLLPMTATTKRQPRPIEILNGNAKNAEKMRRYKKTYFPKQVDNKFSSPEFKSFCGGGNYESKTRNYRDSEKEHKSDKQEEHQRTGTDRNDVPLMKYDKKINIGYTPFTLFVHLTIIFQHLYTLYPRPSASTHITSFTQLVYVTTTCFHIATLLANLFKKCQVEKVFVLYGTWVIWSGWAMCLWLINPENRSDPLLPRGYYYVNGNGSIVLHDIEAIIQSTDVTPFLVHGKWTSTLPILSFFLLLAIRRNHWGLLTWEHLAVLETTNSLKYYRTWCIAGAGAGWILFWEAMKFWCHVFAHVNPIENVAYHTDITRFPGLFNILMVSFASGIFMICWWSFWTFQYKGVVWKKELREGVVVWSSDGLIQVGGVC